MLYTFLFSHKNTTCIRQVESESLKEAIEKWLPLLKNIYFGKEDNRSLLDLNLVKKELQDAKQIPLRDLENVWCTFLKLNSTNALLNVILTIPK